jgi:hypothetical protein
MAGPLALNRGLLCTLCHGAVLMSRHYNSLHINEFLRESEIQLRGVMKRFHFQPRATF